MSKTALFFPGQASQYVGMGKDLYDSSEEVRALYELASEELDADIARLSFEGPAEELKRTRFTQPAILLHSLAMLTVLGEDIPDFDFACGHSLGEYGALAVTGVLTYEDAIRAVVKRATLMEEACQTNPGTMAAVLGLDEDTVEQVCQKASSKGVVIPANFNSAIQIAVSGAVPAVEEAAHLAREAGAKRAIILEVGGAFHSPLMASATEPMKNYLEELDFNTPLQPVIANVTAEPAETPEQIRNLLVKQITAPVKWYQTMKYLCDNDVTTIIEVGPGKVLSGLAKRDMRPEKSINLDTLADIETLSALAG
ncbi:MAG TPA: ACP S-malonyltransferase [candidate division Zixibacteria bacterium]|nr:ACP S-malonyltransferase [candidate division Zixibacteria bacterium]